MKRVTLEESAATTLVAQYNISEKRRGEEKKKRAQLQSLKPSASGCTKKKKKEDENLSIAVTNIFIWIIDVISAINQPSIELGSVEDPCISVRTCTDKNAHIHPAVEDVRTTQSRRQELFRQAGNTFQIV